MINWINIYTQLLAVSGPLQAWSPVVDGVIVKEQPLAALRSGRFYRVPLMLGSSAEDGLISRAKNIKVRAGRILTRLMNHMVNMLLCIYIVILLLSNCHINRTLSSFREEQRVKLLSMKHCPILWEEMIPTCL